MVLCPLKWSDVYYSYPRYFFCQVSFIGEQQAMFFLLRAPPALVSFITVLGQTSGQIAILNEYKIISLTNNQPPSDGTILGFA